MTFSDAQPALIVSRPLRRGITLVLASLLLHLIVLGWAQKNFLLSPAPKTIPPSINAELIRPPEKTPPPPAAPRPKKITHRKARVPIPHPVSAPTLPSSDSIHAVSESAAELEKIEPDPLPPLPPLTQATAAAMPDASSLFDDKDQAPVATPTYQIHPPPSVDLHYDVRKVPKNGTPLSGRGEIVWHQKNGQYSITGTVNWLFITALTFSSEGVIDNTGVSPITYRQKSFRRVETNTYFHRQQNTINFSASDNRYPRLGGEQDRASIIWQLASIGGGDDHVFTPNAEFRIMVAGVRDAEPWLMRVIGREAIDLKIGTLDTWHLVRVPKAGSYEQGLDIWLAPQHAWYPVKIRYSEPNGDYLDLNLTDMTVATQN